MVYAAPMSHGCGIYAIPHLMAGARHVVPASGGVDPAELFALGRALGAAVDLRRADHRQAPGRPCAGAGPGARRRGGQLQDHRLRRRADVPGRHPARAAGDGAALRADLRPGRDADGRHRAVAPSHRRHRASALPRRGWLRWAWRRPPVQVRVADAQGRSVAAGEIGEVLVRGDTVMAGYWRNPEATAAARARRLAVDRRRRQPGRRRLPDPEGPQQGPADQRRLQHLPARGRGGAADGARRGRGGGGRARPIPSGARSSSPSSWRSPDSASTTRRSTRYCLERIARFKRPKRYLFVEALPKNNYGKVLKTELRARLRAPR